MALDFVTLPFLLSSMTVAAMLALFFMSYMTSEEDSLSAWLRRDILRRGAARNEREMKKKRDGKMERLLNGTWFILCSRMVGSTRLCVSMTSMGRTRRKDGRHEIGSRGIETERLKCLEMTFD